ncbi:hypothetical protein H5398_04310 [Tessaracoccus sp. MC1679]|uniref:hypothetical protein n=1 Tax=Tessaracoccus sp. MC1679 TaxID=2760313 RepID=UPI00160340E8|nr:hypothetical protein [Tessaracoccus sp. MC1679]MBB1515201.1 hypothetical protein [Tessaracoccus sp. MC1679]
MAKKRRSVLRLEAPFSSDPPRLTSEAVGLPRILRRPAASYTMDVTILDVDDARLLRAGVIVAHRVIEGTGEWYLAAQGWAPHLPAEQVEPLGASGDLPEHYARLIRPLTRRGVLGPLAALHCERDEWALRTSEGQVAAVVRDERVRIRRSGITTARYREITITPTEHLTGQQREFLISAAMAVNATVVDQYPTVAQRLGAPATGLTSFPRPRETRPDPSLEEYVSSLFAEHLQGIVRADLARRATSLEDLGDVNARLWAFGRDLRGLAPVLEPSWREATERSLAGLPYSSPAEAESPLLDVIDALVGAARAPRLGDLAHKQAGEQLYHRAEQATLILANRCRSLTADSPDDQWQGALRAAEQLEVVVGVAAPLFPKVVTRILRRLADVTQELRGCALGTFAGDPALDGLSAAQAFALGRDAERKRALVKARREAFIERWPARVVEARKLMLRAKKKQAKKR